MNLFTEHLRQISSTESDCAAWREFFELSNRILDSIDAKPCSQFYGFDNLSIEADADERRVRAALDALLVGDLEIEFLRDNLFDARHWCQLPLRAFLKTDSEAFVRIGFKKAIVLSPGSFRLKHVKRFGKRWGRLYCVDPRIAFRGRLDKQGQEVAENKEFDEDTTRQGMWNYLLKKVTDQGEANLFSVTEDCFMDSVIRAQVNHRQQQLQSL